MLNTTARTVDQKMRETYRKRVETLLESLPYIRMFSGSTMVIKYGGAAMSSADLKDEFATDIALLRYVGIKPIIVHGGGNEVSSYMKRLNLPVKFVDGLRVTDAPTMEVAKMVLVGKVNKEIVSLINGKGAAAVGLCGDDGSLLKAKPLVKKDRRGSVVDLGLVGEVTGVNVELLTLLEADYVPVVASVGVGPNGESYNINADSVAGALATALRAEKVIFLTDVSGLLEDVADEKTRLSECTADEVEKLLKSGRVSEGMIPKLEAVLASLNGGARAAHIIDGRIPHSVLLEIMTDDAGVGTKIVPKGAGKRA
jgi:acetylglutamate kinase